MNPEPMQHVNALPNNQSPLIKWFDQHGNTATAIICVAMISSAIWYSYTRTSSAKNENAWAQFSQARTAEDFATIADLYPSTEVASWSRLGSGERLLETGISLMFTNREAGLGDLKEADKAFQQVLNLKSAPSATRERALWGLAKSTETQSDGDTSKAVAAFEALLTQFPKGTYTVASEERIAALKTDESKAFYTWFHKQNPKPADKAKPTDGLPGGHPPIDLPLDDKDEKADAEKPKGPKLDRPEDDKPTEPKSDAEKEKDAKKPDATDPSTDKPKDEPKPTESKKQSAVERLKSPVNAKFERAPLQEAFAFLSNELKVEITMDGDGLKSAGFTKNMPATLTLEKASGLEVIGALLKKYENEKDPIVIVIEEDKAIITTAETAKANKQKPYEFLKLVEEPKADAPKSETPKPESKDAPAESK